jgi:hypothetical protein
MFSAGKQPGKAVSYFAPLYLLYNYDCFCSNGIYVPADMVLARDGPNPYDPAKPYVRDARDNISGSQPMRAILQAPKINVPKTDAPKTTRPQQIWIWQIRISTVNHQHRKNIKMFFDSFYLKRIRLRMSFSKIQSFPNPPNISAGDC